MRCMYGPSADLQSLLHVIEWVIGGGIEQFPTLLGELFEPSPREPVRDMFHLRQYYQLGVRVIR